MDSKDYLKDISEIKDLMNKSSRFISLSGLSGVMAGIYALLAAFFVKTKYTEFINIKGREYDSRVTDVNFKLILIELIFIAICVILLTLITGIILTYKKAKKNKQNLWDNLSKRLVFNFFFPLITGGIFCLVLIQYKIHGLILPTTLIFYGLACVNASKYTFRDVRYLGIANTILGLIATQYIGYSLYFWALGFGVLHIFYGTLMHFKYDRNK